MLIENCLASLSRAITGRVCAFPSIQIDFAIYTKITVHGVAAGRALHMWLSLKLCTFHVDPRWHAMFKSTMRDP